MTSSDRGSAPWYVDHQLVVALRVDDEGLVADATEGFADLLGVPLASLTGLGLGELCDRYLAGSVQPADVDALEPGNDSGLEAQLIDHTGNLRRVDLHASANPDASRTILITDTTELASTQDHLVRRMAHDRLLHILVSDLLDESTRHADRVIQDVLAGIADYFDFVAALLTSTASGAAPKVVAFASDDGCERSTFERLSAELPLIEAPDVDQLVDSTGPGDVWHIELDLDDRYALGLDHSTVTCLQVTVPDGLEGELSFVAMLPGRRYPPKADLELVHKALSHIAQFLRRAAAEAQIRRHSAIDEALASANAAMAAADRSTLLDALAGPIETLASVNSCSGARAVALGQVDATLRGELDGWLAPRPVSPERLGYPPDTRSTWAAPISDGNHVIGLLTYALDDPALAHDASLAWSRLLQLVPATAARLDSERRLEAAFQHAPVGIVLRDRDGRLVDCNDAFLRFIGAAESSDVVGRRQADLIDVRHSDHDVLTMLKTGEASGVDVPFIRLDGETVWGRVSTTRVEDDTALDHVEDVTAARETQEELASQRSHDALTGLPTRTATEAELTERLAMGQPVTVTLVDLDRFHTVNSALGHVAGDRLLQLVAKRLQTTIGPKAYLARAGGDEFIVVAPIASHQLGSDLGERIMTALRQPFEIDGREVLTGASIGVCLGTGATDAGDLLLGATEALAEAKRAGRNRIVHHSSKGDPRRLGLFETALRRAVRENALTVHYQPEVDLRSNLILGAEALVRWQHPTEGLLGAGMFVPLAEEIGLATELSEFVLHEACAAATHWRQELAPNHFKIRVNLSPRDLELPNIIERVQRALDTSGLPVDSLCLEVTETAFMRDQRTVVRHLHELARLGISIAIDDFGTGFSSLWLLRELPFDTLKIDQAFVAALDSGAEEDRAIIETIVKLGQTLGMEVTAEGVENGAQLEALREIGVTRGQGFYFARPEAETFIDSSIAEAKRRST